MKNYQKLIDELEITWSEAIWEINNNLFNLHFGWSQESGCKKSFVAYGGPVDKDPSITIIVKPTITQMAF